MVLILRKAKENSTYIYISKVNPAHFNSHEDMF